jgi:hypothetical protein
MRLVSLFLSFALSLAAFGCAPDSGVDPQDRTSREEAALSVPFQVLPFAKSAAPAGVTVIKSKAQFKSFFGVAAPGNVDFLKSWVVHYSLGIENTGGYKAEIVNIERTGSGATKLLTVETRATSPGPMCMVTMSLTNPQVAVVIKRQAAGIPVDESNEAVTTDCSEPSWCAAALCPDGTQCDEPTDSCQAPPFCPKVKCANGFTCDEEADACVPRPCDPDVADTCPGGFVCHNSIVCITTPCPVDYRCIVSDPCGGVTYEGECDDNTLKYCEDSELHIVSCASQTCGFDSQNHYYDCL